MPDSRRYLPPDATRRLGRLELQARHVVEGFLSGMHRSPYFGQSIEFVQHRQYVPGDDLRHIDWKVWARQDRLVIKQYEEETNLRCTLLVDGSASMSYGKSPNTKYDYARLLAACISYILLRQQDSVGCVVFDEAIRSRVPWRSQQQHLRTIVEALERQTPKDKTNLDNVFRDIVTAFPKRGLMVLISDLLGAEQETLRGLGMLRKAGHDVLVFHVLHDDEIDFPFSDPTRFEGLECAANLTCNPRALREGYIEALQRFLERVRKSTAAQKIDYMLVRSSDAPDAALARFLHARMSHHSR